MAHRRRQDGRRLVAGWPDAERHGPGSGLWSYPVDTRQKPTLIHGGNVDSFQSEFGPDGHWLAYARASSGHSEVYVEPVPATGDVFQVSTNGGTEPHWRRDGRELFDPTQDHWLAAAAVPESGAWDRTVPTRLFSVPVPETLSGSVYSVSRRSGEFAVNTVQANQTTPRGRGRGRELDGAAARGRGVRYFENGRERLILAVEAGAVRTGPSLLLSEHAEHRRGRRPGDVETTPGLQDGGRHGGEWRSLLRPFLRARSA